MADRLASAAEREEFISTAIAANEPNETHQAVDRAVAVVHKWLNGEPVSPDDRVWASYGLGMIGAALAETFDAVQVETPTGIVEASIGLDDALLAVSMLSERYAEVFESRFDLFRRPSRMPNLPTDVEARRRLATDDEVRTLVGPICDAWRARATALRQVLASRIPNLSKFDCPSALWPEPGPAVHVALYRWFDSDDRLIYVGITNDMSYRQASHAKRSSWSHFAARCTVERFPDRASAELAEVEAIRTERPLFNHQHNDTAEARERLVAYLVEHDRLDLLTPAVSRG